MNFRKSRVRSRRNSTNFMIDKDNWRTYGRRLSRRDSDAEDESDDDESHREEVKDWAEEFFGRRSVCGDVNDQDVEVKLTKKQTIILSTLLPDEILKLEKFDFGEPKRFVGVLMMADVSGYTALSERYNNMGENGTYRLTVTLNTYLGALTEIIYSHGGDILKFAGDAFLALWKTDKRTFIYHTIHTVIACALLIQHSYARYETDVKVNLRVKLAISAGNLMFSPIGTGIDMNYVVFGLPVVEAKLAESLCASGEVKVTPTAWAHCYSRNYDHVLHDDGHVTIKSILYDPQEKDVTKPFVGFGTMVRQIKNTYSAIESLPDHLWESTENLSAIVNLKINEAMNLRKTILIAEGRNIGSEIRKFMIRPVLTQIDAHQPLEYLTEMRQVSVLFLTLKPRPCPPAQLITIVNNSYQVTCEIVYKSMGCVNKIILFDKDVMTLVIFGLRGFKHESEAQAALKCAYSIKKSVSAFDGVLEVSVGVTTGQVYCGVIGHPLRREFTVIGAIVNKAARLMCSFRNKITCDEATFVKCKISNNGFTLQPRTELKGIEHAGKIYEYTEEIRAKELYNIPMTPPLLNRTNEMENFENWLDDSHSSDRDFSALLLIGETRIGKSRLLEWMARTARTKGLHVCYITLTSVHSANPYLALSQIVNQMLGLQEPVAGFGKEKMIIDILKNYDEDLCYLNNIIKVHFAYHERIYTLDENKRTERAMSMFTKLITSISEKHVILIDDLQNLDASSWEFISIMFRAMNFFTILTVTRGKFSTMHKWLYDVFTHSGIRKVVLGPLLSSWIAPLACQILDVDAVPNDLCNALRVKCKGMPGLVESFIVHLFSTGAIELKNIYDHDLGEWENEDLQFPNPAMLHAQALHAKDQQALDELIDENATGEIKICVVTEKSELNINIDVQNIDALIMIQIDALTPYQQLLLKIASVIGNVLSRDLLEHIMYENDPLITAKAIKRLFSMRTLSCANLTSRFGRRSTAADALPGYMSTSALADLACECRFEYDPENNENLPKYAFCKVMKFRNKKSRQICYELLPMNQKKEFHSRIVKYLENNQTKCTDCGGAIMVVQSIISLQCEEEELAHTVNVSQTIEDINSNNSDDIVIRTPEVRVSDEPPDIVKIVKSESFITSNYYFDLLQTARDELSYNDEVPGRKNSSEDSKSVPILKKSVVDGPSTSRRSTKRVTMTSLLFKDVHQEDFNECKIFGMLRPVIETEEITDWHSLGVTDSTDNINGHQSDMNKKGFSVKIEKGVSQTNFMKCTCAELNIMIKEQLINHAKQAEMINKAIEFILQLSYLNLMVDNIDSALERLEEARNDCSHENALTKFERRRFLGKIHALKTVAYLLSGKLLAAKLEMEKSLLIYGLNPNNATELFKIKKLFTSIKLKNRKHRSNEMLLKSDSIFCINIATLLYCTLGDDKSARACAFRALELVQMVDCPVVDICNALSNAIQIDIDRGFPEGTADTEQTATKVLRHLPRAIQADELYSVGKLFMATFRARLARADLPGAIRSGFRSIVVSHFLYANNISIAILPDLFYVLLCRRRIKEAIDVLRFTQFLGQSQESYACETWYYALCMDLILDAGFQVESPSEINRFSDYVLRISCAEGPERRRLVVNLWTYWLRVESDRKARHFETEALNWANRDDDDGTLTSLLSALRLVEGMLESLARKMDDLRKVVDMIELRSIADRELTRLEKDCRLMRCMYPRWLRLKGYSLTLSGRANASTSIFNQAMDEARKINNHLEEALARAAMSGSRLWTQNASNGHITDWQAGAEQARASWHHLLYTFSNARRN